MSQNFSNSDLSIVIFYSNATVSARQSEKTEKDQKYQISKQVKEWSSNFIDTVINQIDERLKDKCCEVPVYRNGDIKPICDSVEIQF